MCLYKHLVMPCSSSVDWSIHRRFVHKTFRKRRGGGGDSISTWRASLKKRLCSSFQIQSYIIVHLSFHFGGDFLDVPLGIMTVHL